jgi:hypothetical protein
VTARRVWGLAVAGLFGCGAPPAAAPDEARWDAGASHALGDAALALGDALEVKAERGAARGSLALRGAHALELTRTYALDWERVPRLEAHPSSEAQGALLVEAGGFASSTGPTHLVSGVPRAGQYQRCDEGDLTAVRWESFSRAAKDPTALEYSRFEGLSSGCRVRSTRSYRAPLPALVPELVYVFRTCDRDGCDAGVRAPGSLVIVTPEHAFAASLGQVREPSPGARAGSYARVELPLAPGATGAATATLTLTGSAILAWREQRGLSLPKDGELELSESRLLAIRVEATTIGGETELSAYVRVNGSGGRQLVSWLEAAAARRNLKETP